jgi:hypothetical protein
VTLAEVDREAAEEAALQGPSWDVEQLRGLAELLTVMAGEATQQERYARTLDYKLRMMLHGMPNTRRVDMMAASMRAVLGAISRSATQVLQASKALHTGPFSASGVPDLQSREKH